jgi:hypothetical protein
VRSLLYDFMQADKTLLEASDAAARHSFYHRFHPTEFPDWPRFLEVDGEEFAYAALENMNLWMTAQQREALAGVCWKAPDPHHSMDMRNYFKSWERGHRERYPEWFAEDANETSQEALEQILERLDRLETALQSTPRKRGIF